MALSRLNYSGRRSSSVRKGGRSLGRQELRLGRCLDRQSSIQLTPQQRDVLARTIYGEASNQADVGQQAVANVILNRARMAGTTPDYEALKKNRLSRGGTPVRARAWSGCRPRIRPISGRRRRSTPRWPATPPEVPPTSIRRAYRLRWAAGCRPGTGAVVR